MHAASRWEQSAAICQSPDVREAMKAPARSASCKCDGTWRAATVEMAKVHIGHKRSEFYHLEIYAATNGSVKCLIFLYL